MIKIENVSKSFGDNEIFTDYSLTINDGDFVVFAGESGCGKTTLLNMIGGLEKVDKGRIIVDDVDVTSGKKLKEFYGNKIGFLFQNFALVENKTVSENLEYVQKKNRTDISIDEALEKVGLSEKKNEKIYKLSGGEQQRVALARLIIKKCNVILADEPTGSLDSNNGKRVLDILHNINDLGKTIVLVTHNKEIIESEEEVIML